MKKLKTPFCYTSFLKHCLRANKTQKLAGMAAVGAGIAALGQQSQAQVVVIEDHFSYAAQYHSLNLGECTGKTTGQAPDTTNLPGGNWQHINGAFYNANATYNTPTNDAEFFNDAASGINLGSYDTGSLQLSAGVCFGSAPGSGAILELGYSSQLNTASNYGPGSLTYYTGLAVLSDGSLQDYVNGSVNGSAIAYAGTFNALTPLALTYAIDTTTGSISSVSFAGSTANYSFQDPGAWSSADTANTQIGGFGGIGGGSANVSSYVLSTVPEPSTYGLLASGVLALGAAYRRRQGARG